MLELRWPLCWIADMEDAIGPLLIGLLEIGPFGCVAWLGQDGIGLGINIASIKSDHGVNLKMKTFKNILRNFSYPRTPQQNIVGERKNRSLQEMTRTVLNDFNSSKSFWAKVVNKTCYLQNRIYIRPILKRTHYELWKGRQPNISFTLLDVNDNLRKFDPLLDKGTFLGYSNASKAYRVYNSRILTVEESIHMSSEGLHLDKDPKDDKFKLLSRNKVRIRSTFKDQAQVVMLSKVEPKSIDGALLDKG
ncbi:Copia protein, partial [Mucuna pruriens]